MFIYTISRLKRSPFYILAMVLFSTVLVAVLCSLNKNIEDEIAAYEEAYRTIPVTVQMTDLAGVETDNLSGRRYVMNVFRSEYEMGKYLKDIELKAHSKYSAIKIQGQRTELPSIGITSLKIDADIAQQAGTVVAWMDGYDESILKTEELVCIIPQDLMPDLGGEDLIVTYELICKFVSMPSYHEYEEVAKRNMKVVGTHNLVTNEVILPFDTIIDMDREFDSDSLVIVAASATVADNYLIDELKQEAYDWFAIPNDTGEKTKWEFGQLDYYPTALKIDDSRLHLADAAMQNSIKINTMCAYIVLGLSAVAGFFVGFLAVRSRKREITLMRSLGNSGLSIFVGCCAEQLLCLVLGTAIGGAAFMWRPIEQIGIFMGIYFIGTIISLVIFISRNLLQGQKEDE